MTGIYKITSPTGCVYIGQSINIPERINQYRRERCNAQPRLYNSLKKHGFDAHVFEILTCCSEGELNHLEAHYIKLYDSFNTQHGMNLRSGGGANHKCSEETKSKIREKRKLQKISNETREKLRHIQLNRTKEDNERIYGNRPPITDDTREKLRKNWLGRKHRPESIQKMRDVQKGRTFTEQTKRKMSEAKRNISDDTRKKYSEARMGKRLSPDAVKNSAIGHQKKIKQFTIDGEFVMEYDSTIQAAYSCGTSTQNISGVLNGRQKTAGGFIWKKS